MNNKKENKQKKEVKVINVPKKKRPLATPSYILRIFLILGFVCCILLLSSPFLQAKLYITEDLQVTASVTEAYRQPATQEALDDAENTLQNAIDSLEKSEAESQSEESDTETSQTDSISAVSLNSANYQWSYTLPMGVDAKPLAELVDYVRNLDKSPYTAESIAVLNQALLNAQKILCASVVVTQSVTQMAFGGAIGESLGTIQSLGISISHSLFAIILAVVPFVCFITLIIDRKKHIKHIVCMIGAIICLADIFILLYPYVGIGAVLSIILYIIICVLNLASIYAKQQEDYIIRHPELEPEFTEKHPQFVKALINYKAFNKPAKDIPPQSSAKNKHSKKKK